MKIYDNRITQADLARRLGKRHVSSGMQVQGAIRGGDYLTVMTAVVDDQGHISCTFRYRRDGKVEQSFHLNEVALVPEIAGTRESNEPVIRGNAKPEWVQAWRDDQEQKRIVADAQTAARQAEDLRLRREAIARGERILLCSGVKGQAFEDAHGILFEASDGHHERPCCLNEAWRLVEHHHRSRPIEIKGHSEGCVHAPTPIEVE